MMKNRVLIRVIILVFLYTVGYIFYESIYFPLVLLVFIFPIENQLTKYMLEKSKEKLLSQFQQLLIYLSSYLATGKSIENSFRLVLIDLCKIYPTQNDNIIDQLKKFITKIDNGDTLENSLLHFSINTNINEINQFVEGLIITIRKGGNQSNLIRNISDLISEKCEVNNEISVQIASKKFEAYLIMLAPIIFFQLLKWSNPEYMTPLFTYQGNIIVSAGLIVIIFSYILIFKIIKVAI
jgi:tight adherence protein B